MTRGQKKPTGELGVLKLGGPEATTPSYTPIVYPERKEDLENWILERAVRAARGTFPFVPGVEAIRNAEDDFDYTIPLQDGSEEYLDLMEIVLGDSGHAASLEMYFTDDAVKQICDQVARKDEHYGVIRDSVVHLLLYATDFKSRIGDSVTDGVACNLWKCPPHFASVNYFVPYDNHPGRFVSLFPLSAQTLKEKCRRRGRRRWVLPASLPESRSDKPRLLIR